MNLASEKQPLASEIIADQSAEIEKLKAELQDKQENLDICAGLADRYMYRQRIVECTLKLKDEKLLKSAYTYMKKLTEGKNDGTLYINSASLQKSNCRNCQSQQK